MVVDIDRWRVLRPVFLPAQIHSVSPINIDLDCSCADSDSFVAAGKCRVELDFFPQEKCVAELRLLSALCSIGCGSRWCSVSNTQPICGLVRDLPRLPLVCNMVGLLCLAPQ